MEFKEWLNRLIEEKGLAMETVFEVEGASGTNFIPAQVVAEHILIAPLNEKKAIRKMIAMIDFRNGNVMDFFKHPAKVIAK